MLDEGAMGNAPVGGLPVGKVYIMDQVSQGSGQRFHTMIGPPGGPARTV